MSYQLELRHLRYFLAVAEELHFKKAAEKLFISQPGLSRQIKKLEEELGVQLLKRHNRKVELTHTGQYLKTELKDMTSQLDQILNNAQSIAKGFDGHLKFGYVGSAMHDVIPKILVDIRKEYPNIWFDMKEMDNQKQIEGILSQEIDLGFVRSDKVSRDIEIHPIYEDTFSLVLPKNHRITNKNFKSLSQLKDEPFILFDSNYSQSYFSKLMNIFEENGFVPHVTHKTVHAHTIYSLVENNFGISIVPTSLQKGYKMKIRFIELKDQKQRTSLQIIWNKNNESPVLQNAIKMIDWIR